ncbi:MAG: thioredoxin domain-containing protein [Deltaproteobacteria bacterium]|nr:thioredoxin domain-containing protein [Deltaproteobacteria bacterium]
MNRLAKEKSPYLLQHQHNPVEWYPWGEEAFQAAHHQNKPIFLSIGYSTCYWCHMMEKDSFELAEVADVLNQNFISIKVDREEHPDIDQIYMDAVVSMTGQGGWPMSVFLAPDLKPFYGGTFFWRQQFVQLLNNISAVWKNEPEKILKSSQKITEQLLKMSPSPPVGPACRQAGRVRERGFDQLRENFDPIHGGFGQAPKFPHSMDLNLLLHIHKKTGNAEALEMAKKTLTAMANGEIYDKVGGGFHRYATREDWSEPHYEKMLYDNALLAMTYLEAGYKTIAQETLDYVLRDMSDPQGGFYSAQDAGEVGKEGEYYHWTEKTIEEERAARTKRKPPHKDDKILTSWNGLMIAAMAKGAKILGEDKYLKAAQNAADFIRSKLYKDHQLLRRFRDGEAKYSGTLDDYAFLIFGLLELGEIEWAKELQKNQDDLFWDEKEGGYFFTGKEEPHVIIRKKEYNDGALPSGNAVAAGNLLQLFKTTCEEQYREKLETLLQNAKGRAFTYPAGFASLLIADDDYQKFLKNPSCPMPQDKQNKNQKSG